LAWGFKPILACPQLRKSLSGVVYEAVKLPISTDPNTGTSREQESGSVHFVESVLGRDGIGGVIFLPEEEVLSRKNQIKQGKENDRRSKK
jgi:hypothetical protein